MIISLLSGCVVISKSLWVRVRGSAVQVYKLIEEVSGGAVCATRDSNLGKVVFFRLDDDVGVFCRFDSL